MGLGEAIRQYPEWVALLVSMGGLAFQQWQIRNLDKRLAQCNKERFEALEQRQNRLDERIGKVSDELLKRTDIPK